MSILQEVLGIEVGLPLDPATPRELSLPGAPRQQGTAFLKELENWGRVVETLRRSGVLERLRVLMKIIACNNHVEQEGQILGALEWNEEHRNQVQTKLEDFKQSEGLLNETLVKLHKAKAKFEEGKSDDGGVWRRKELEKKTRDLEKRIQRAREDIAQKRVGLEDRRATLSIKQERLRVSLSRLRKKDSSDEKHPPSTKPTATDETQAAYLEKQEENEGGASNSYGYQDPQHDMAAADEGEAGQTKPFFTGRADEDFTMEIYKELRETEKELRKLPRKLWRLDYKESREVQLLHGKIDRSQKLARDLGRQQGRQYKKIVRYLCCVKKKQGLIADHISKAWQEYEAVNDKVFMLQTILERLWKGSQAQFELLLQTQIKDHRNAARTMAQNAAHHHGVDLLALCPSGDVSRLDKLLKMYCQMLPQLPVLESVLDPNSSEGGQINNDEGDDSGSETESDLSSYYSEAAIGNGSEFELSSESRSRSEFESEGSLDRDSDSDVSGYSDVYFSIDGGSINNGGSHDGNDDYDNFASSRVAGEQADALSDGGYEDLNDQSHQTLDVGIDSVAEPHNKVINRSTIKVVDTASQGNGSDKSSNNNLDIETGNNPTDINELEQHDKPDNKERPAQQQGTSELGATLQPANNAASELSGNSDRGQSPPGHDDLYSPLDRDTGEIRLLLLYPAPTEHYPIICELQTITLWDVIVIPKYAALSYCWGSPPGNQPIYMLRTDQAREHHGTVKTPHYTGKDRVGSAVRRDVHENLYCALHRLRRHDKAVLLWVDSLCINQGNDNEKSHQINDMMSEIYKSADRVCVWLGESSDDGKDDKAMDFIPHVVNIAALQGVLKDRTTADKWEALAVLMRDQWFSRRWVVQEILLARKAMVQCGTRTVLWTDFVDAITLLVRNQDEIRRLFDQDQWYYGSETLGDVKRSSAIKLLDVTGDLFTRAEDGTMLQSRKSLEYLVTSLTTFDAGDARDIIYSLSNIANDTGKSFNNSVRGGTGTDAAWSLSEFSIDYRKPTVDVCIDFTRFCIGRSKSLDIICRHWAVEGVTKHDTNKPIYPSWIPMLQDSEFGKPGEARWGRKNGISFVGLQGQSSYNASAGRPVGPNDVNFLPREGLAEPKGYGVGVNCAVLEVTGFTLGTVQEVSSVMTAGMIPSDSLLQAGWPGRSKELNEAQHSPSHGKRGTKASQVWRILIADRDGETNKTLPSWYKRVCEHCLTVADNLYNGNLNLDLMLLKWQSSPMVKTYLEHVRETTWNRRFVSISLTYRNEGEAENPRKRSQGKNKKQSGATANEPNTTVALCPADTQTGDIICILFGCTVPVVLRPFEKVIEQSRKGATNSAMLESCGSTYASVTVDSKRQERQRYILIGECYAHGYMEGEAVSLFGPSSIARKFGHAGDFSAAGDDKKTAHDETDAKDKARAKTYGKIKKDAQRGEKEAFSIWTKFRIL